MCCAETQVRSPLGDLVLQPVHLVLLAINGGALAVSARLLAICSTATISRHGAILGRRGTISGGTLTVPGPAPSDLPARIVHPRMVVRRQFTITFGANLIALGCHPIATVATHVTTSSGASTQHDGLAAFACVAIARVAH
jgi:hypothetical protein